MANTFANVDLIGSYNTIMAELTIDGHVENIQFFEDDFYKLDEIEEGHYISVGEFQNTISVGGHTYNVGGNSDGLIIEINDNEISYAGVKQHLFTHGTGTNSLNYVCKTFDGGNIVSGTISNSNLYVNNDLVYDSQISGELLAKVGNTGNMEWEKVLPRFTINSITEDKEKNIIVGASTYYSGTYEGITYPERSQLLFIFSSTGEFKDGFVFNGCTIPKIIVTDNNELIISGSFTNKLIYNNQTILTTGSTAGYILKMNNQGGILQSKKFGEGTEVQILDFDITTDNCITVVGYFTGEKIQLDNYEIVNTIYNSSLASRSTAILIKFNSNMELEWYKSASANNAKFKSVVAGKNGAIRIAGESSQNIEFGNNINYIREFNGGAYIVEFNAEGEAVYLNAIDGHGREHVSKLIPTNDNGVIVTGSFNDILYLNKYTIETKGSDDCFVIKYNSEGKEVWLAQIGGTKADSVLDVSEMVDGKIAVSGTTKSSEFLVNGSVCYVKDTSGDNMDGFYLTLIPLESAREQNELIVTNNRKEYKITTDIYEIDNIKGGTISGEDKQPYEVVKYGDDSIKEIKMIPNENYEIIGITVNGKEWLYDVDVDGSYTMPTFENMTEDKHIVVTYSLKDNKIIINKKDSINGLGIEGSTFKLDQIEERVEPDNTEILGEPTPNGNIYTVSDYDKEVEDFIDLSTDLKHVEGVNYYFVPKANADQSISYVPTNSKTWQTENVVGATSGVQNSTANSYVELDLSEKTGTYKVVVNGYAYSESSDYGYATLTTDVNSITDVNLIPKYSSTSSPNSRFIFLSGTSTNVTTPRDRESTIVLNGGQKYYLHLGYRKDSSQDTEEDQFVINSIKLYETKDVQYGFEEKTIGEGAEARTVYQSTNEGTYLKTANA